MFTLRPLCLAVIATLSVAGCSTSGQREQRQVEDSRARKAVTATERERGHDEKLKDDKAEVASTPPPPSRVTYPSKQANEKKSELAGGPHGIVAAPKPAEPALETIAVSGSRIRRVDIETASPVLSIPSTLAQSPPASPFEPANRENYAHNTDNPVLRTSEQPVSTFSIDVDTGSYSNVRHMLNEGRLPPADAVRAEEFINYFDYAYVPPRDVDIPFSVTTELAPAPWNEKRTLLLVGVQGYRVDAAKIPAANLVFLIDTSGSMESPDKLELLKASFKEMLPRLRAQDRVSIVVYAGSAGLVLAPTPGDQRDKIASALDQLQAGGSTNGGAGIELAYATARQAYIEQGVNRVILATDGDFNVGTVSTEALKTLIADKRKSGIALTTLGFGEGNYNDAMAEQLADVGNGNHYYIDTLSEGKKVLQDSLSATVLTIAKDVKIQIEFNPAVVQEYRLIGYENRLLRREDFNNDKVDAGEIGAGANVTALYELTLNGSGSSQIDPLRYTTASVVEGKRNELGLLRLRYKLPEQDMSRLVERPIATREIAVAPSERLRFAAAVGAFADALRGGTHAGNFDLARIANLAEGARGNDISGYRSEFVRLVHSAAALKGTTTEATATIAR